jgi:hypothetical protein
MPKLKEFLNKIDKKEMSDEEMYETIVALNKQLGGE